MTVWVCDWTHWQGVPLPAAGVANEGFGMVKLKAGGAIKEGRYFEDPTFFNSAVGLVREPRLIPAAYWYLMPGRASAQAGLFFDMLNAFDVASWAAFLDVEQGGVTWTDVHRFAVAWHRLSGERPLGVYTSKRVWSLLGTPEPLAPGLFTMLEEAHWVNAATRGDERRPYASQQAKAIDQSWWHVGYAGWAEAGMIQFTDNALVQGRRTSASLYRGTQSQLRQLMGVA